MRNLWSLMARRTRSEEGFTLIELLVVIAILAVIAAIAIPRVTQTTNAAKDTRDHANAAIIQSAVERYYVDNGSYPADPATHLINFTSLANYISQPPKNDAGADDTTWYLDSSNRVSKTAPTP